MLKSFFHFLLYWIAISFFSGLFNAPVYAGNIITIGSGSVIPGEQIVVEVIIDNADDFVAFQLDIPLPEQLSYIGGSALLNPDRITNHSLSAQVVQGNILRIISFSITNEPYTGNSGAVMYFTLDAGTVPGSYLLNPQNGIISGTGSTNILSDTFPGTITILGSVLQTSNNMLLFGDIPLNEYQDVSLMVSNSGNQDLVVSDVVFDNQWFSLIQPSEFTLSPGSKQDITVRFYAQDSGTFQNQMVIHSNDPHNPEKVVALDATAFAVNEIHAGNMFSFSGESDTLTFSINNMEEFVAFQFNISLPDPLTYIEGSAMLTGRKTDHQVSAGIVGRNTLQVVAFSPTNASFIGEEGHILDLVFEVFGTGGFYPLNISELIIANAEGNNIVSDYFHGMLEVAAPDIYCNPSLDFGDVSLQDTSVKTIEIFNYGSDDLIIDGLHIDNDAFFLDNETPILIEPSQSIGLNVFYHFPVKGSQTGTLKILSNDPDENPFNVSLTAFSFAPNYMFVENASAFRVDTVFVDVSVDNYEEFVAFEFLLQYPDHILTFLPDEKYSHLSERAQGHELTAANISDDELLVFSYSLDGSVFLGNSGSIVTLAFLVDAPTQGETYPLQLSKTILSDPQGNDILYDFWGGIFTILFDIYTISYLTDGNGTLTGETTQHVEHGGSGTAVAAIPNTGYHFAQWSDGVTDNPRTDENVTEDLTVTAEFSPNIYNIVLSVSDPEHGSVSGGGEFSYGTQVTVSAIPETDYFFINWTENGSVVSTDAVYDFILEADRNLTANFFDQAYIISITTVPLNGGTVSGAGNYAFDSQVTLQANPSDGYHFLHWTEDGQVVSETEEYAFTATENRSLVAHFAINTYTIIAQPNNEAYGSVTGSGHYEHFDEVSLIATPNIGYHFINWTENGEEVSTEPTYTFIAETNRSLIANFAINVYTLTYLADKNGTLTGETIQHVEHGGRGTAVAAIPNTGYHFTQWSDGVTINPRTDENVTEDLTVTAEFSPNIHNIVLSVSDPEHGSVSGGGEFSYGTQITVSANAETGYSFTNWIEDGSVVSTDADYSFVVETDRNLTANFSEEVYAISVTSDPLDGGTVSGAGNYAFDSQVTLQANPSDGYHFLHWTEDGQVVAETEEYAFTATENRSLVAHFAINTYTIIAQPNNEAYGSVTGSGHYEHFDEVSLIATPNIGYHFINWTENGEEVSTKPTYTFIAENNRSLIANFAINVYTLTYLADENGTLTGETIQHVEHGGSGTAVAAIPNTGYHFAQWSDGVTINPRTDEYVTEDLIVSAEFSPNMYSIALSVSDPEQGTVSGGGEFAYGTQITVSAVAETGYFFTNWIEDGSVVSTDADYSFVVETGRNLTANFSEEVYAISVTSDPLDGGTVSGAGNYAFDSQVSLQASPSDGYHFLYWTEDGQVVAEAVEYVFTATQNRSLVAHFAINTYTITAQPNNEAYGSVTGAGDYEHFAEVTLIATPNIGSHFINWTENGEEVFTEPTYTFIAENNRSLIANFAINVYTLTYLTDENGTLTGETIQHVEHGGRGTAVAAIPNTGYHFAQWSDGVTSNPRTDENVMEDLTVTAEFNDYPDGITTPSVETSPVTQITHQSAQSGGNITYSGGSGIVQKGVVWGTDESPTLTNNLGMTDDGTGEDTFVSLLSGLDPSATYYVRAYAINEADSVGYGTVDVVFTTSDAPLTLCEALDNCDLVFTTGGDADWYAQTDVSYDGFHAAHSGSIVHTNETWLQTSVEGPGVFSFWWMVSSEGSFDFLRFFINDAQKHVVSGTEHDWQFMEYNLEEEGTYVLKWVYDKDAYITEGSDGAWIDMVVFEQGQTLVDQLDISKISVFPNPFYHTITIEHHNMLEGIVLTNVVGQVMEEHTVVHSEESVIHTAELPKGIYLVKLIGIDGKTDVRKLIKR